MDETPILESIDQEPLEDQERLEQDQDESVMPVFHHHTSILHNPFAWELEEEG